METFKQRMINLGYSPDQIQIFQKPTKVDYIDEDGDPWGFLICGIASKGPEKHFHVETAVGLTAEVNGNSVHFFDENGFRQSVDLGKMSPEDKPNSTYQRYMRVLCRGDEASMIDDVEDRLLWNARADLLTMSASQCMLHTLRYEGNDGEQVLAVLHANDSHTICAMCNQYGVEPVSRGNLADPGGFYQVIVAATPGMSLDRIDELLFSRAVERVFGPVEHQVGDDHNHHHRGLPN